MDREIRRRNTRSRVHALLQIPEVAALAARCFALARLPGDTVSGEAACGQEAEPEPAEVYDAYRDAECREEKEHGSNEPK